jgi:DNA excision repair protein ERCC-4
MKESLSRMIIIIDTREQLPFSFDGFGVETVRRALPEGDYAIDYLDGCVIERKGLSDLLGCMTTGRSRFQNELERLRSYEFSAVVIEGSEYFLYSGLTGMNPKSTKATLVAWQTRYPTHWIFCQDRRWAEKTTFLLLERFHRDTVEGKRKPSRDVSA